MKKQLSLLKISNWLLLGFVLLFVLGVLADLAEREFGGPRLEGYAVGLSVLFFFSWIIALISGIAQRYSGGQGKLASVSQATGQVSKKDSPIVQVVLWSLVAGVVGGLGISLGENGDIANVVASGVLVGAVSMILGMVWLGIRKAYNLAQSKLTTSGNQDRVADNAKKFATKSITALKTVSTRIVGSARPPFKQQQATSAKYDNLIKLKQLVNEGILSEEEFESEKERIMSD